MPRSLRPRLDFIRLKPFNEFIFPRGATNVANQSHGFIASVELALLFDLYPIKNNLL